jgi:hypothetical protein
MDRRRDGLTYDTIAQLMLARVPALEEAYNFAVFADYFAVTVFLGNAAKYVLEQTRALAKLTNDERQAAESRLAAIFEIVEQGISSHDDKLRGAVSAAFIEELDTEDAALFREVVRRLGPETRERVRALTEFYHSKKWLDFLAERDKQRE